MSASSSSSPAAPKEEQQQNDTAADSANTPQSTPTSIFQNVKNLSWGAVASNQGATTNFRQQQQKIPHYHDMKFQDASKEHPLMKTQKKSTSHQKHIVGAPTVVEKLPLSSSRKHPLHDDPLSPLTMGPNASSSSNAASNATSSSSKTTIKKTSITGQINRSIAFRTNPTFLQWNLKANHILKKYTTNKNIPIISNIQEAQQQQQESSIMDASDLDPDAATPGAITLEDRLKMRLESLKAQEDLTFLTQTEYIKHLETLNEELAYAWNKRNDRVKSLKIVIKCCKMLGRNPVPQCYPSIFVLVSRVLDTFGQLVKERIRNRATIRDPMTGKLISKLPRIFEPVDVPEQAKDVCRNWFYKISSIRELIARIYVEMSIFSCTEYLVADREVLVSNFTRLAHTIRGIGDPLVSTYARTYLTRKMVELIPDQVDLFVELFSDFLENGRQMVTDTFKKYLKKIEMTHDEYLNLFQPAIEWMLETIGANSTPQLFDEVLNLYQQHELMHQCFVIDAIIRAFDPELVSRNASLLVNMIFESEGIMPKHQALKSLGEKFAQAPPPRTKEQLQLLNVIWKHVAEVESMTEYMQLAEVYIEYVSKAHSQREVNVLLRHIHSRLETVTNDIPLMDAIAENMENIMLSVMENVPDFVQAFNMEYFLPIFDMLKPNSRVQVSKGILLAFSRREGTIADPVILNSLYELAKSVHDSVNELTPRDTQDDICFLLEAFITRVDYGSQFDKQLSFYVDCRRAFSYYDRIKRTLATGVLTMCMRTLKAVRGNHNKKTTNFVKACIAFCHITIPSINDEVMRLRLYLQSAQVALANNLFSQAETFLQLIISDFSEMSPTIVSESENNVLISIESDLVDILSEMAALLVAVPGHPEKGPFVLIQGLLKVIQSFDWEKGGNSRVLVLSRMLRVLYAFYQGDSPYQISTRYTNADLFVIDAKYKKTVEKFINGVIQLALQDLEAMSADRDVSATKKRAEASLELVNSLAYISRIDGELSSVLEKCVGMAKEARGAWKEWTTNTLRDLKKYGSSEETRSFASRAIDS